MRSFKGTLFREKLIKVSMTIRSSMAMSTRNFGRHFSIKTFLFRQKVWISSQNSSWPVMKSDHGLLSFFWTTFWCRSTLVVCVYPTGRPYKQTTIEFILFAVQRNSKTKSYKIIPFHLAFAQNWKCLFSRRLQQFHSMNYQQLTTILVQQQKTTQIQSFYS